MADIKRILESLAPIIATCEQETQAFMRSFQEETATLGQQFLQLQTPLENAFNTLKTQTTTISEFQQSFDQTILHHIETQIKYSKDIDAIPDTLISPQLGK